MGSPSTIYVIWQAPSNKPGMGIADGLDTGVNLDHGYFRDPLVAKERCRQLAYDNLVGAIARYNEWARRLIDDPRWATYDLSELDTPTADQFHADDFEPDSRIGPLIEYTVAPLTPGAAS